MSSGEVAVGLASLFPTDEDVAARFFSRLQMFAWRRLGDWETAADVAQEALARVIAALRGGAVRNPDSLPGFVFQVARHVCLHHIRSLQRERRALARLDRTDFDRSAEQVDERLVRDERIAAMRAALHQFDDHERELLRRLYVDGVSLEDLARREGLNANTVRVRKHRLLRRLKEATEALLKRSSSNGNTNPD